LSVKENGSQKQDGKRNTEREKETDETKRKKEGTRFGLARIRAMVLKGLTGYGRGIPEDFLSSILLGFVGFKM